MAFYRNVLRNSVHDIRNHYICPYKSLSGRLLTRYWSRRSKLLTYATIDELSIRADHYVLEVGYGRGEGISRLRDLLQPGDGYVFGLEASGFMHDLAMRRFGVDVADERDGGRRIELNQLGSLPVYPYPDEFFDSIFHVDVFCTWGLNQLDTNLREIYRVMKPGAKLVCGMDLTRLRQLSRWEILRPTEFDPMRYMESLEPVGFTDVKMVYRKISPEDRAKPRAYDEADEVQFIHAKRPEMEEEMAKISDPLDELEMDIKRDLLLDRMKTAQGMVRGKLAEDLAELENSQPG